VRRVLLSSYSNRGNTGDGLSVMRWSRNQQQSASKQDRAISDIESDRQNGVGRHSYAHTHTHAHTTHHTAVGTIPWAINPHCHISSSAGPIRPGMSAPPSAQHDLLNLVFGGQRVHATGNSRMPYGLTACPKIVPTVFFRLCINHLS
jgi:hypothetical protein